MKRDFVLNIGNSTVSGAFFENDLLVDSFHTSAKPLSTSKLEGFLESQSIERAIIGSDNSIAEKIAIETLEKKNISYHTVDYDTLSIKLDVDSPKEVGQDRIANSYGALYSHRDTDIIVIDMGTAITFDVITKDRAFIGGAIYPGFYLSAKVLADLTERLPLIDMEKPKSCLSKSTIGNIQSGLYYGLLGTVEKIITEIKKTRFGQANVIVIATGGLAGHDEEPDSYVSAKLRLSLEEDLKGIINYFEPDLSFIGLHQILKEKNQKST